jgi:glutamine synthetase
MGAVRERPSLAATASFAASFERNHCGSSAPEWRNALLRARCANVCHENFASWIKERGIGEIECLIPDLNGVIRGKVFPAQKFLQSERDGSLRIPSSIYLLTVTGEYADDADEAISMQDPDVVLRPDSRRSASRRATRRRRRSSSPTPINTSGEPYDIAPRYVLKRVS